jgi:hypothetical protein
VGPTGATGPTGPAGSSEATSFGTYTGATSTGGLASGKQESGAWSAKIHAAAGEEQQEGDGTVSFPIPLKFKEKVKLNYRNEVEALLDVAPCLGSPSEPVVQAGNFCAYRGGGGQGSKEKGTLVGNVDRNVQGLTECGSAASPKECKGTEVGAFFQGPMGSKITETGEAGEGDIGVVLVFRSTEFSVETAVVLKEESNMTAKGSWAVTAK